MSNTGRPDPQVLAQLQALLTPEAARLLESLMQAGSPDALLAQLAQATGWPRAELARLLQDPRYVEEVLARLAAGGDARALQLIRLLRQAGGPGTPDGQPGT